MNAKKNVYDEGRSTDETWGIRQIRSFRSEHLGSVGKAKCRRSGVKLSEESVGPAGVERVGGR